MLDRDDVGKNQTKIVLTCYWFASEISISEE